MQRSWPVSILRPAGVWGLWWGWFAVGIDNRERGVKSKRAQVGNRLGRPPEKRHLVVDGLRGQIVSGGLPPGAKLPGNLELKRRFAATSSTVTEAVAALIAEGFVETVPRRGTFVVPHPPHLTDYAIAFPWPENRHVSHFFEAIRDQAAKLSRPDRRILFFHGITELSKLSERHELARRVQSHRLAGLIFAHHPYRLMGWPLLEEKGIPRVIITSDVEFSGIPVVYPDMGDFLAQAVARLAATGRRRVALLVLATTGGEALAADFRRLAREHGLLCRPEWVQAASREAPQWAGAAVRLLLATTDPAPPDALIIADDNLVPAATQGVLAAGKRAPDDILVVAHANFPLPTASATPVLRLGYDINRLVATCLERLDQQRRGETPPECTLLPARFADE